MQLLSMTRLAGWSDCQPTKLIEQVMHDEKTTFGINLTSLDIERYLRNLTLDNEVNQGGDEQEELDIHSSSIEADLSNIM